MARPAPGNLIPELRRHLLVRGAHIGKKGVAAFFYDFDGVQHGPLARDGPVAAVGVPYPDQGAVFCCRRIERPDSIVGAHIGHPENLGGLRGAIVGLRKNLQRAEVATECDLLRIANRLRRKDQDAILVPGGFDGRQLILLQRLGQTQTRHFRADQRV